MDCQKTYPKTVLKTSTFTLENFSNTKIEYRKFIKLDVNPFIDTEYFEHRKGVFLSKQRSIRMFFHYAYKSG
jgi:RNA-directed DNA polymerase